MVIKYLGLSCFQLKVGETVLVTDPFDSKEVGIPLPAMQADVVIYSQPLASVSAAARAKISPTEERVRRGTGVIEVDSPGEYEVGGIFVQYLDKPRLQLIAIEDVMICYIGPEGIDQDSKFDDLDMVDYLIVPVGDGGRYMASEQVDSVIKGIDPGVVVPSCYHLAGMKGPYDKILSLDAFFKSVGVSGVVHEKKLKLESITVTEESQYSWKVLDI